MANVCQMKLSSKCMHWKTLLYFHFQDVNITKSAPVLSCQHPFLLGEQTSYKTIRTILTHFSHRHWHYGLSKLIVYSQIKVILLTQRKMCKEKVDNDPRMGQTGYISSLTDHCLFRCSCWTGMEQPKHESDPSFKDIFPISSFVKSKGKRTPFHPNCLSCAHAWGVTWHIRAGEEQWCWKLRQISHPAGKWNQILSSENATHL